MTAERDNSKIQQEIDRNLKRVYDDALNQEIPERFKKLLEQLKSREPEK